MKKSFQSPLRKKGKKLSTVKQHEVKMKFNEEALIVCLSVKPQLCVKLFQVASITFTIQRQLLFLQFLHLPLNNNIPDTIKKAFLSETVLFQTAR